MIKQTSGKTELFEKEKAAIIRQYAKSGGITIEEHNRTLKERADVLLALGYISRDLYELLCKACEYHDLGKANPRMQARLENNGLKFESDKEIPHNILSMYLIPEDTSPEYYILQFAVGFHHDYGDIFQILQDSKKQALAKTLLAEWKCAKVPGRSTISEIMSRARQTDTRNRMIMVKGLLHKCDYAASGETEIEYKNDFLLNETKRFFQEKGFLPNEMQQFCLERQDENIMVVGQTGMGKTEAALLWIGDHKGFLFLPVKTAINKMYDRIKHEILQDGDGVSVRERIGLLHSDAISKLLEGLGQESGRGGATGDFVCQEMDVMEYHSRSRQLAMPITVSTVDQLFDFVFQYQTYELKLATLAYSKLVIDEIQMYGADLLADLVYGLKLIRELGGRVAITTATLAPFVRELIEEEVGKFEYRVFCNQGQVRHKVKLLPEQINPGMVVETFWQCMANEENCSSETQSNGATDTAVTRNQKNGKILVICNTIKKAQWMYEEICGQIGEENRERVHLLHAKFIRRDRVARETAICQCGKFEHQEITIWISTSLVEASLDIDFDFLFTELQDLASLLQRMGRVNRRGAKEITGYNCFVYTEIEEKYLEPEAMHRGGSTGKSSAFIDRDLFILSRTALEETLKDTVEGELSEGCKIAMMDAYFTSEKLKNSSYMKKYRDQLERLKTIEWYELNREDVRLREDIYTKDVIPYSVYEAYQKEIEDSAKTLRSRSASVPEKIRARDHIMQYSVPVQNYIVYRYHTALRQKKSAMRCEPVQTGTYETIDVIDCDYDDRTGFREKIFEKIAEEPIFV